MNTDKRPDSLAAQAASWVPPWERPPRPPDRAYQAAVTAAEGDPDEPDEVDAPEAAGSPDASDADVTGVPDAVDEDVPASAQASRSPEARLPDDDEIGGGGDAGDGDDASRVDTSEADQDGLTPPVDAEEEPPELPPLPGEAGGEATVDAPADLPGEREPEPTDVDTVPEVPLSTPIEDAAGEALESERGASVDAPIPVEGDDAGGVFDAAADDDVGDDAEMDLPLAEEVPLREDTDEADAPDADREESDAAPGGESDAAPGGESETAPGGESETAPGAGSAEASSGSDPAARGRSRSAVPVQGRGSQGPAAAVGEPGARTPEGERPDGHGPAAMHDGELRAALEAILLVVDEPVGELQLAQIVEQPTERVAALLEDISARYTAAGHGFDLRRVAGGWRLYTRPEYAAYVERFVLDGQSVRLTQAALETLAVVAYRQPVTRSRISAIRGVNCDGVMRTLVTRGLIEECGIQVETGAYLYRTTSLFLEKLGLNSVDQLPPLAPFLPDDVEEVLDASG